MVATVILKMTHGNVYIYTSKEERRRDKARMTENKSALRVELKRRKTSTCVVDDQSVQIERVMRVEKYKSDAADAEQLCKNKTPSRLDQLEREEDEMNRIKALKSKLLEMSPGELKRVSDGAKKEWVKIMYQTRAKSQTRDCKNQYTPSRDTVSGGDTLSDFI